MGEHINGFEIFKIVGMRHRFEHDTRISIGYRFFFPFNMKAKPPVIFRNALEHLRYL